MTLAGTLKFNPLTDKLTDKDGKEFLLKEPTGDGLPSRGYDPGQVSSYRAHHYCQRIANERVGDLPSAATRQVSGLCRRLADQRPPPDPRGFQGVGWEG